MADDQSSSVKPSDLQVAKASGTATMSCPMAHQMGLARYNRGSKNGVYTEKYYISGEKSTYNWIHNYETSTVFSSLTFTNQTKIPFIADYVCYYIVNDTETISADNEYPTDDNGNGWTVSSSDLGNIDKGHYSVQELPNPELNAKTWTAYSIAIGDILYSDGALSHYGASLYSPRTAIAIVFKIGRGHNSDPTQWTHGYAMGLREFNYCAWSNINRTVNSAYSTTFNAIITDYAGYSKTLAITQTADFSSTTFPAAYKAWNYNAKSKNGQSFISLSDNLITVGAHWFLPSGGQWYMLLQNLGGVAEAPVNQTSQYAWLSSTCNSITVRNRINNYITPIINAGYATATASPTAVNLETENVAVRKFPYVSGGEATALFPCYDNTYKTSTETGTNIISVVLFGAAPDLCITVSRTGDGYEKTPSTARDSMRPIIGF